MDPTCVISGRITDNSIPHSALLVAFVEAILENNTAGSAQLRTEILHKMGAEALVDVCAAVASFNAVVKVADGTGIPLEQEKELRTRQIRQELALDSGALKTVPET